jgi:hypothetical protein
MTNIKGESFSQNLMLPYEGKSQVWKLLDSLSLFPPPNTHTWPLLLIIYIVTPSRIQELLRPLKFDSLYLVLSKNIGYTGNPITARGWVHILANESAK